MKWVLNTYETCQDWDVDRIIEVCRSTGYSGIDFLMDFGQRHGVEADAPASHVEAVGRRVMDAGLTVASLTSCMKFDSADSAQRDHSIDQVRRVIDHARAIRCDHVRVLGDSLPQGEDDRRRTIDQVGAAVGVLGRHAAPSGITVSMEMHGDFTDPELALAVVKRAAQPNVGLVFNSQWRVGVEDGWSLPAGASSIRPLYDLTGRCYTSVHTHQMEDPEELGYYHELFVLLRRDGYEGYISNECAYQGPDSEKVLGLYTALFQSLSGG